MLLLALLVCYASAGVDAAARGATQPGADLGGMADRLWPLALLCWERAPTPVAQEAQR